VEAMNPLQNTLKQMPAPVLRSFARNIASCRSCSLEMLREVYGGLAREFEGAAEVLRGHPVSHLADFCTERARGEEPTLAEALFVPIYRAWQTHGFTWADLDAPIHLPHDHAPDAITTNAPGGSA